MRAAVGSPLLWAQLTSGGIACRSSAGVALLSKLSVLGHRYARMNTDHVRTFRVNLCNSVAALLRCWLAAEFAAPGVFTTAGHFRFV